MMIKTPVFLNGVVLPRRLCVSGVLVAVLTMTGCATPAPETVPATPDTQAGGWTACESPRPKVCTMEYAPVCAKLDGDNTQTYPSRCNACADVAVSSWRGAPCEES